MTRRRKLFVSSRTKKVDSSKSGEQAGSGSRGADDEALVIREAEKFRRLAWAGAIADL